MRLPCPLCGDRDLNEFVYRGDATVERPTPADQENTFSEYVHLRHNKAGWHREFWYHDGGCGAWLVVERNTLTHEVAGCELAASRNKSPAGAGGSDNPRGQSRRDQS